MLIAACAALVLLMLLWPMDTKNTENEAPETVELTAGDYTRALSAQIAQMVSAITGESEPQVTVTLRTMGETVYATEDKQSEKSAEEYSGESLNRTQTDGDTQKTYILVKAADGFEEERGLRFSTYAVPMIIGEIRRYLRDNNAIRVSRSLRDTAYRAICARELYLKQNQKEPSIEEIAAEIGIGKEDIVYALDAIQSPMSLYEPVYTEGGDTLYIMDQLSDKKNKEENWVQNLALQDAVARLNERERQIIRMRFYEGQTQMEVAREIGISQAQVSRLEKSALRSMRNYLSDER